MEKPPEGDFAWLILIIVALLVCAGLALDYLVHH